MKHVDGFARVITDSEGMIISVVDFYWNHEQLYSCMGSSEIKDYIYDIDCKDAEVLLILKYFYQEGKWIGAEWSDPEQCVEVITGYILKSNYQSTYLKEIQEAWKHDFEWRYVDDMIRDYKEMYNIDLDLNH